MKYCGVSGVAAVGRTMVFPTNFDNSGVRTGGRGGGHSITKVVGMPLVARDPYPFQTCFVPLSRLNLGKNIPRYRQKRIMIICT